MKWTKEIAGSLTPIIAHKESMEGLRFFLDEQIKDLNSRFRSAPDWETVLRLQGEYQVLSKMLTIQTDAQATLKGNA